VAQAAEELGYASLVLYDHVLGAVHAGRQPPLPAGLYDETHVFHEPLVTFAYLAALTRDIVLRTGVLVLAQRQTALVAKQAAQLAVLSGGRFVLGVGTGWNWVEYEALGVPWPGRSRRLEEQVGVLRALWDAPAADITGEFHRIDRAGINPRPPAAIPIWFGGSSARTMERAVRLGDGFVFSACNEQTFVEAELLREALAAAERPLESMPMEAMIEYSAGPDAWVGDAARWAAAGGTHLTLRFGDATAAVYGIARNDLAGIDDVLAGLERFAEALR
jgi:probable F420-dependent oxidoreductase